MNRKIDILEYKRTAIRFLLIRLFEEGFFLTIEDYAKDRIILKDCDDAIPAYIVVWSAKEPIIHVRAKLKQRRFDAFIFVNMDTETVDLFEDISVEVEDIVGDVENDAKELASIGGKDD